jgi:acetyl-CoA acyltransferase
MREAVIVSSVRTAVGRAGKGALRLQRPDDMAAAAIKGALARVPAIPVSAVDEVVLGCAMPEAEQGMNVARIASFLAGLPASATAMTVNRFCASGLEAIVLAVDAIEAGRADVVVAGGTESMSLVPMGGNKLAPNPTLLDSYPDVYLGMGLTAELVARKHAIDREHCDAFALESHRKALAAIDAGRFRDEIVPLPISASGGPAGAPGAIFDVDEGPRRDTSADALARLKPAFAADGVVTAGNASQTSDAAAASVIVSTERARELGLRPLARLRAYAVVGVPPELMGIGPVDAIPRTLRRANLALGDVDLIELNEAFAAQSLACIRGLELDAARVNVRGGAIALGHPIGSSGCRILVSLLHAMKARDAKRGMAALCIGVGQGIAMCVER